MPLSRATSTWGVLRSTWAVNRGLETDGDHTGATIAQIRDHLLTHRDEPIDYRTVATHLRNLKSQSLLVSQLIGRKLHYRPVVPELVLVADEIRWFLDDVIHDDPVLLDELERQLLERRSDVRILERQRDKSDNHQAPLFDDRR